jgi:twitching motility protein PilT
MDIKQVLSELAAKQVADIFIVAGRPVSFRADKAIESFGSEPLTAADTAQAVAQIFELAGGRPLAEFEASGDDDFSFALPGVSRFRVNAYKQRGSAAAVIRVVPFAMPDPAAMRIPEVVMEAAQLSHGLVLVTGPAGSGKTTTLACIIDRINHTRSGHIVTLENPIEFLHSHDKCLVSQREISIDTADYASALRAILRESPDVILIGEMRDPATIAVALTAAETGHLVFSTLHTVGAAGSIDRLIDSFAAEQQSQVRMQLSLVLQMVVSQQLLAGESGHVIPAFEVMKSNNAIANLIREGRTHQIGAVVNSSAAEGMIGMDAALYALYRAGEVSAPEMLNHALAPEALAKQAGL